MDGAKNHSNGQYFIDARRFCSVDSIVGFGPSAPFPEGFHNFRFGPNVQEILLEITFKDWKFFPRFLFQHDHERFSRLMADVWRRSVEASWPLAAEHVVFSKIRSNIDELRAMKSL
ncbi:MAG: hypothetical protein IPI57_12435 [Candidatus Competibacteraceae bacterium]|nr:hypothetical protein [Candidatus Competibacteraceae bacterium]